MPRLKINNSVFYREYDISKEQIGYPDGWRIGGWKQEDLIKDIDKDIIENPAEPHIPPHQTHAQLFERMKGRKHWDDLYHKVKHTLMRYYTKEFTLMKSWANVSKEDNQFGNHTHSFDLTVVYYLKCTMPVYGTYIVPENVMIPAVNDSLLIFNGQIMHRLQNMPYEIAIHPHNHRYSIVYDFNIDK